MAGVLALLLCAAVAVGAETGESRLARAAAGVKAPPSGKDFTKIRPGAKYRAAHVLVRFATPGPGLAGAPAAAGATRARLLTAMGGAKVAREHRLVPGLCRVKLPPGLTVEQAVARYNKMPGVVYAQPDYEVRICTTPNDLRFGELWGMHNTGQSGGTADADIDAPEAWDIETGSTNVIVAVIDTGVDYTHEDLAGNMWHNPGEIPGNGIDDDGNGYVDDVYGINAIAGVSAAAAGNPMDDHSHGTHCAGTIGGVGNNGVGVAGVCWRTRIMALKFLNSAGSGDSSDAITCFEYAIEKGARVLSCSWGGDGYDQAMKDAIDAAGAAGIVVAIAAGNAGTDNDASPYYPASYDSSNIISVMATDNKDAKASFSCYGQTTVDLAAPGVSILSCLLGGGYKNLNGTSMATPHVAGACALLLSRCPALTPAEVKEALLSSVDVPATPLACVSRGRMNVARALGRASLSVAPGSGCVFSGPVGGPFAPASESYSLSNRCATAALDWTATNTTAWCYAAPSSGTLAAGASVCVVVGVTPAAAGLSAGLYTGSLVFSNLSAGLSEHRPVTLAIVTPPVITSQPTNQAVLRGQTASFTVGTASNGLQYFQWRRDGGDLTASPVEGVGATSSTWTVTDASPADAGGYSVVISNAEGVVTSATAVLSIVPSVPVIAVQPTSQTALPGQSITFSVVAVGDQPFFYRWRKNGTNLTDGVKYSGCAGAVLSIDNVYAVDAGSYSVVVSNVLGAATSSSATLGVTSITAPGVTIERIYAFPGGDGGYVQYGGLTPGSDGNLYGIADGGPSNSMMAYRATPEGIVTTLGSFTEGRGADSGEWLERGADANFYGVTEMGGANDVGTVYRVTPEGDFAVIYSFARSVDGWLPGAGLALAPDGNFYGTTSIGGTYSVGVVFRITPDGVYTPLVSFSPGRGTNPGSKLIAGRDGCLYGTTQFGGTGGYGTVFRVSTSGVFTVLANLTSSTGNNVQNPLAQDSDGNLYGVAPLGGPNGQGSVFKVTPDGVISVVHAFTYSAGPNPCAPLTIGADGNLYGTTRGGTYGDGTLFRMAPQNGTRVTIVQLDGFVGRTTEGWTMGAKMTQGADGHLYGTARGGPFTNNENGVIFRVSMDGAAAITGQPVSRQVYAGAEASFNVAVFGRLPMFYQWLQNGVPLTDGDRIAGSTNRTLTLRNVSAADAASYSVAVSNALGQVTSSSAVLTVVSSGPVITKQPGNAGTVLEGDGVMVSFAVGASGNPPLSYLWRLNGTDLTDGGRISGAGASTLVIDDVVEADSGAYSCVVSNDLGSTVSSNATVTVLPVAAPGYGFATLHGFTTNYNGGTHPWAGLLQAPDGNFYGSTLDGGLAGYGTLFRMTPAGAITKLVDFHFANGATPVATLTLGPDGNYYGTTRYGGPGPTNTAGGTAFRLTPGGVLTTLWAFLSTDLDVYPTGGLTLGSDGNLYGTTQGRGSGRWGSVYRMTPAGAVSNLHTFTSATNGIFPWAGLVLSTNGFFYGVTAGDVSHQYPYTLPTAFRITSGGAFASLAAYKMPGHVSCNGGAWARLIQARDGKFYGTTWGCGTGNGVGGNGTVFRVTLAGAWTDLVNFCDSKDHHGNYGHGGLVEGPDGTLYGTTVMGGYGGGYGGCGTVFALNPTNGVLTTLVYFTGPNGAGPRSELTLAADGSLYGTTRYGGDGYSGSPYSGNGTIFRITLPGSAAANPTLRIESEYGAPMPPVGLHTNAYAAVLTNAVASPVPYGSTTQYVCTGWTMSGNEPLSGASNQFAMTVTNDAVLTWRWETQYWLNATVVTNAGGGK